VYILCRISDIVIELAVLHNSDTVPPYSMLANSRRSTPKVRNNAQLIARAQRAIEFGQASFQGCMEVSVCEGSPEQGSANEFFKSGGSR
jgi:hypothetical protein